MVETKAGVLFWLRWTLAIYMSIDPHVWSLRSRIPPDKKERAKKDRLSNILWKFESLYRMVYLWPIRSVRLQREVRKVSIFHGPRVWRGLVRREKFLRGNFVQMLRRNQVRNLFEFINFLNFLMNCKNAEQLSFLL